MTKHNTYTKEQFIDAVKTSYSIREVLLKLKLTATGAAYTSFKRSLLFWSVDASHFTGKLWSKGKKLIPKRDIQDYLSNKQPISSHALKLRLLKENIFKPECSICGLTKWNNDPIPLELDHINGNHSDNSLSNLRLTCPNCHAQTNTHAGRNKKKHIKFILQPKTKYYCICGKEKNKRAKQCLSCARINQYKIDWPTKEELLELLKSNSYTQLAKKLGVSDNAIRKHLK